MGHPPEMTEAKRRSRQEEENRLISAVHVTSHVMLSIMASLNHSAVVLDANIR